MIDTFYDDTGALVTREISPEERIAALKRANGIHQEDVYDAIILLKRWLVRTDGMTEDSDTALYLDTEKFLSKLGGPPR